MTPDPEHEPRHDRVLVLALTARDGTLTQSILKQAGIVCTLCADVPHLCAELDHGAAVVVLPEEVLTPRGQGGLLEALGGQPRWSDLPLLVLTRARADSLSAASAFQQFGNVTLLERPVRVATLVSTVRTSLRARARQYEIRAHLLERERAEEALREADRRKDEFLAMLAHELRNPLTPIVNALQILKVAPHDPARVEKLRELMERQTANLRRLLDDLLDMARVTQGKVALKKEPVDLEKIVRRAVESLGPTIEEYRHDLSVSLPLESVRLEADATRLEQVLANLLHNAAKYTDPGGRIWLTVERAGWDVVLRVRDTGIGIAPETLPHIFGLFAQADQALDRSKGGLGIGLTLVRTLVEMHGGSVAAHSPGMGQGSEFIVRLPALAAGRAHRARHRLVRSGSEGRRLRILVVEDHLDTAELLAELLRLAEHQVCTVHDGPAALAVAPDFRPEVVLCDLGLPGMDGYEVARRLRQQPPLAETVFLAITGYGQEEARARCEAAGFDLHLVKPVDPQELSAILAGF